MPQASLFFWRRKETTTGDVIVKGVGVDIDESTNALYVQFLAC